MIQMTTEKDTAMVEKTNSFKNFTTRKFAATDGFLSNTVGLFYPYPSK